MDSSIAFQAVAILILIALSSFFSSAETAMTTVNKIRIQSLAEQGNKRAVILEKMKAGQEEYCVEIVNAGIKDIILPGEIREIMNTVLVAEKKAQANVIMRREEVASTRSLLNTAKLMEENRTLMRLKEMEYLEKICDKVGSITLNGGKSVLDQLSELTAGRDVT